MVIKFIKTLTVASNISQRVDHTILVKNAEPLFPNAVLVNLILSIGAKECALEP